MAYIRASQGGGGSGEFTPTTIWFNSNDTATQPAINSLTLYQSIANFKYIKVKWKRVNNTNVYAESIISVEELRKCTGSGAFFWSAANIASTDNSWVRVITYIDDTHLKIGTALRIANTTSSEYFCIISEFIGLN